MIHTDNQATMAIIKDPVKHQRAKHFDIQYKYAPEKMMESKVEFAWEPIKEQEADIFTKAQGRLKFNLGTKTLNLNLGD